jgi:putative peptidoglycan lipid II flippase
VAGVLGAGPLISLAAPGFAGAQRVLAIRLARLVMPALFFLGLSTLTTAALHAQKRFVRPALGEASFRAGPLLVFLAVGGMVGYTTGGVHGLALGTILGALGKLLIEGLGLSAPAKDLRPSLDLGYPSVRVVGRLAAPLLAALSLSLFVGPLVENAFASRAGVGGVSALAYARKIVETLTTILPYTLGLVLLPFSTEMAAGKDHVTLARTLGGAVRVLTLLFLPVTVGLILLREPFIRLLFERGAFTATSTELTAGPLLFYALALLPFSLEVVVIQFFFAQQDTRTPVIADVIAFALNVALIPPLMGILGLGGIALAAAIAKALKVFALLAVFGRRVRAFRLRSLGPFAGKMLAAAVGTAAVLLLFAEVAHRIPGLSGQGGLLALLVYLSAGGGIGGATFFLLAWLLRVREVRDVGEQGLAHMREWLGRS